MTDHHNPLERTDATPGTAADPATEGVSSIGDQAGVFIDSTSEEQSTTDRPDGPPSADHRPDTVVRGVGPDARRAMERGDLEGNEANFTKGRNAPTANQMQGSSKTVGPMDEYTREAPRDVFTNMPGGAGATPLSADRHTFIAEVTQLGHFPSRQEAEKWTRAVFNALRQRALDTDDPIAADLSNVVRVGETPRVQVEEMMWGGDFIDRLTRMASLLKGWSRDELYRHVAAETGVERNDPWVDAAIYSFLGAIKRSLGDDAARAMPDLGELQDVWERA